MLHDVKTGDKFVPLRAVRPPASARFDVFNSPLSEMGVLGFEYGYSLDCPDGLVIWEAQFGDFANGAQVIIDQFIAAGESKWQRLCGLTLLLPHGYEGQGPEHSSARLERFLSLCAEDNIQVGYPTTPAQIFHLLRRQVLRPLRKPLVIMSPKSLLRRPEATSKLDELATGTLPARSSWTRWTSSRSVTRLLLCSGKVYYDLVKARDERKDTSIAIVRVEQLYPFPCDELAGLVAKMPKLTELFWVQEEPRNIGRLALHLPPSARPGLRPGPEPAEGGLHRARGEPRAPPPASRRRTTWSSSSSSRKPSSEEPRMAVELKVPPLGESITEAVVGKWNKKEGEAVSADEPLVVLETDKVTIDVPAPAAGAIAHHRLQRGRQGARGRRAGHHRGRRWRHRLRSPRPPAAAPAAAGSRGRRRFRWRRRPHDAHRAGRSSRRTSSTWPSSRAAAPAAASPRRTCSASSTARPRPPPSARPPPPARARAPTARSA